MNALELIQEVESHGGKLVLEEGKLRVKAPQPLPDELRQRLTANKPLLLAALGAPMDVAVSACLADLRPYLSRALRRLPDEKLLALVNLAILTGWQRLIAQIDDRVTGAQQR